MKKFMEEKVLGQKPKSIVKNSNVDPYTLHLQSAYDWYNDVRKKENKTPIEISYIIEIEEKHKLQIISQFHKYIREVDNTFSMGMPDFKLKNNNDEK